MKSKALIYVDLQGYPEKVWHPVAGEHLHGNCYLIIETNNHPDQEHWQFQYGEAVRCEAYQFYEGESGLIAVSKCECQTE